MMLCRSLSVVTVLVMFAVAVAAEPEKAARWWGDDVEKQLAEAKGNRAELEKALNTVPQEQRKGMAFIIANMPAQDLTTLSAEFLLTNHSLAYRAREETPWGKEIPEEIFFNNVLPYANVDEKRDPWRKEFFELCMPMIKECKTPAEAAQKLNSHVFHKIAVKYSPQRRAPNLSPKESMAQGNASCTGLSIVLSDACRAVGVPARLVGTPNWSDKRGNHTWVEIWDKDWHFTGACEQDPKGLNRGWFVGDASKAQKDVPEHAIYAVNFKKSDSHFPLVWNRGNRSVPGENVTDRYAKKEQPKPATVRVAVRVVDENKKRVPVNVTLVAAEEDVAKLEGKSRDESADLNDYLTFELPPGKTYTIRVGGQEKKIETGKAGELQIVDFVRPTPKSSEAIDALKASLAAKPKSLADLLAGDFVEVAIDASDAATARKLIWEAHEAIIRAERAKEIEDRVLREGEREMPFDLKTFGEAPKEGRSLWISLHGGGGAPKQVNDQQWHNQKRLYKLEEGIYLTPRAPTNTWNLWHEAHIDRMFQRLIEDLIVLEGVNPDRVYVLGYSAGGDGVYQLGPRMADYWAGAAMMAGHPNGVSLLSLRNVAFALQVGANDSAYDRNKVGREYGEQLAKLQAADPAGYQHYVKIHEGKGHWMNLEDAAALPWMAKFTRNPVPTRIVWKQTGTVHDRSYWLAVPMKEARGDSLVVAQREGQTIDITDASHVSALTIRLDERMLDMEKPVVIRHAGKKLFNGVPRRTIGALLRSLIGRGDPRLMFDAEVALVLPAPPPEPAKPAAPSANQEDESIPRNYVALKAEAAPTIDGKLDDDAWKNAPWSGTFVDIEGCKKPKPRHATRMKMLWDDKALYIAAELEEPHVWATLTQHDAVIYHDLDFEVFIDPDGDNFNYGELELNARNTTWDLLLTKPYRDGGRALNGWEIIGLKTAVHIDGTLNDPSDTDKKWTVEIAWPWDGLKELSSRQTPPKDGDQWRINFSRVQWETSINEGKYVKVPGKREDNWVWSPQGAIDMHRPERWGYVQFSTAAKGPVEFKPDAALPVKNLLHEIYYGQHAYRQKNGGKFAATFDELNLPTKPAKAPVIKLTDRGFDVTIESEVGDKKVWGISSDGHLWSR